MIKTIARRKHFKLLREQLKGSRKLINEKRPFFVEQVFCDLANISVGLQEKDFPDSLVGAHAKYAEISLRQTLLRMRRTICSAIMQSIGSGEPAKFPVPDSWIRSLESSGIHVSRLGCKISLYKLSALSLLKGIAKTVLLLLQYKLPALTGKPYIVFINLTSNNLPVSGQTTSYDIISWYKKSGLNKPEIHEIWAEARKLNICKISSDIYIYEKMFPPFTNWLKYIQYLCKSIISIAVTFAGIIQGKWWYGLLYEESVLLHYVSIVEDQDLAREYLFHNSHMFHKPLWTYEAEKKGSDVRLYYYSTNIENFQWTYRRTDSNLLRLMQWKTYIVWDKSQKDFLKRYCPEAEFQVAGSIDFVDSSKVFKVNSRDFNIAVFDVTPTRPVFYTGYGWAIAPYWSEKLIKQFFSDIGDIVELNRVNLLWKQKRFVGRKFASKGFMKCRNYIIGKYYTAVDPDVSARRLIEVTQAVISIPFTSTAIIAKELGRPSVYYDPSGTIKRQISHGISVLKNRDELTEWYYSLNI